MSLLPYGQGEQSAKPSAQSIKDVSHLEGSDTNEFRKGTVSAVQAYGLFVNLEGVDGLLHISKMRSGDERHIRLTPYVALSLHSPGHDCSGLGKRGQSDKTVAAMRQKILSPRE